MAYRVVFDSDVYEHLLRLKTKIDGRIILMILNHKMIDEDVVTCKLKISMKILQKSLKRLIDFGLVKRIRHKVNHNIRLTLNQKFSPALNCVDCEYCEKEKHVFLCMFNKRIIKCVHDEERIRYGLHKLVKDEYEEIDAMENLRGSIGKGGEIKEDIKEWSHKDFTSFYLEQFKVHYPDAVVPNNKVNIRERIKELMKLFRSRTGDRWKYVLKHYIAKTMSQHVQDKKIMNPSMLTDPLYVNDFLKNKGFKITNLSYCKQHNILCSYALKDGNCNLDRSNMVCDESIVERMKERYN